MISLKTSFMNYIKFFKYLAVFFLLCGALDMSAATASEIMNKAARKAKSAQTISGTFSVTTSGKTFNGSLKASGSKFSFLTPMASSWYNGKNMWTYNASSKETTLVTPTASEIAESNPFEYLRTYSANYNATFSNKKIAGKYVIVLLPKSKRNTIKSVEVSLNGKTLKPERFVITPRSGASTTINVKSLEYSGAVKASEFEYPKSKYPGVQIIDLR
jgi:outer membrane lipoprotein carrier protein lolA